MAVTNTYTDYGSYRRANLTGTGTMTLNELYLDLYAKAGDAETYMTKVGDVYSWVLQAGEIHNAIYINSGVTFEIEDGQTLNCPWSNSSGTYWVLYLGSGSAVLKMGKNTLFDNNPTGATYARGYIGGYGKFDIQGELGEEAEFKNMRSVYAYTGNTDAHDVNHLKITDTSYSSGYLFYTYGTAIPYFRQKVAHSWKNVTISDKQGWGYVYLGYGDYSAWTLENWVIDNPQAINHYFLNAKFKDSEFKNADDYTKHYSCGFGRSIGNYKTSEINDYDITKNRQNMLVYDTCTFDAQDAGVYQLFAYTASTILCKDCSFKNGSRGLVAQRANVLLYGTQTFENITVEKAWSTYGAFLHVRKLDITVNDSDGQPLEKARVSIRQNEGKEEWQMMTDENGNINSTDGAWIYLTEKEETSNGVYDIWSDGTGDLVHTITVSHPDYATHTEEIAMTSDKVRTITMSDEGGTVINESTLNETVVN